MEPGPPVRSGTMKAWILERYGTPDNLAYKDIPFPPFQDGNEVLIRVIASSVNPADKYNLSMPFIMRRRTGFSRPKTGRVGLDLAGRVEQVGPNVKGFQVGDEVFGVGRGSYGEFAISDQIEIAPKPARLTFDEAAALPIAAVTALQGLRDQAQIRAGQRVLINGAAGGVGSFAVQIAKALGADVSCVCGPQHVAMVTALGVTRVFDYSREDFTRSGEKYDVIFDTQSNHSLSEYRRTLVPKGLLMVIGFGNAKSVLSVIGRLIGRSLGSKIVGPRTKFFIASVRTPPLMDLKAMVDAGKLTPVVGRRYPMTQVPDALRHLMTGHASGKIVVTTGPAAA